MPLKNKEIAEMLNISPATVSMALNNKPGVREETKKKVLALRDSSFRKTLNTTPKTKNTLLFCILKIHGEILSDTPFFMSLTESLNQQILIEGYEMQSVYFHPNMDLQEFVKSIDQSAFKGILLLATEAKEEDILLFEKHIKIPVMILDSWFGGGMFDCVLVDNAEGITNAMQHACDCGHKEYGFIQTEAHANNNIERFDAYRECLDKMHLSYDEGMVLTVPPHPQGVYETVRASLEQMERRPSIFICSNDVCAMGGMNAAKSLGLRVPEDISFVGFDDNPTCQLTDPPVTSIRIYIRRLARMAVVILADRIRQKTMNQEFIRCLIGTDLKVRGSVWVKGT